MKKTLLTLMASLLLSGAAVAQHYTAPNAHSKSSNTPIVAAVTVDGAAAATGAELAVYVDDELRGLATTAQLVDGKFWVQVYYDTEKPSDTDPTTNVPNIEDLTFKLWDPTGEGTELTDYTLTYTDNGTTMDALTTSEEGWGTPGNPVAIDFATVQTMTQTSTLAAGWTWWSTPIEMVGNNGLQQLESSISQYGVIIKSKTQSVVKRGSAWQGNLTELTNEKMYKINVTNISSSSISGIVADPSDHTITIYPGWNWIGYPVNVSQSVSTALANFQPTANDIIKNLSGSAVYRGGTWRNSTPSYNLVPGNGYMYFSNASESKELVFSTSRGEVSSYENEEHFWIANNTKYENNIVLVAVVLLGEDEQRSESLELGAFVDGECTGSSKLFYVENDDRYYAIMTIGGNDNDRITFGLIDESKGVSYNESSSSLVFRSDAIVGDFDNPYKVCFNTLGSGEGMMQVAIYPNPVNRGESFKLNIPQEEVVLKVSITNALGSVIRNEEGALKSTLSGLSISGVYTVKVTCQSGNTYYGRLIVK